MTNEITRENVQAILDRNTAEAKRKEAYMDAQERQLRLHINGNHATKTMTESQREKQAQEAMEAELAKRQERRAELAQEGEECNAWYQFTFQVVAPLILASMFVNLADGAPIAIVLLIAMTLYTAAILLAAIKAFFPKHSIRYLKTIASHTWPKMKEYIVLPHLR